MIISLNKFEKKEKPEEMFDVQPTTSIQTITPTEGYVFNKGIVEAVTSDIDNNIQPNNIKQGVSILGVEGTLKKEKPEEIFNIQPTTTDQAITPTEGSVFISGTVRAVTSNIDINIQPENIKQGVSILGVEGTLTEGGTPNYHYMNGTIDKAGLKAIGWTDEDILTYEQNNPHYPWQNDLFKVSDENKTLYSLEDPNPSSYKDNPNITFVPKKNMESYFSKRMGFHRMKYIKGIPFYDTSGVTDAGFMFGECSSLTSIPPIDLSSVTNASNLFYNCISLTSIPPIDLSSVTNANALFSSCRSLTSIPPIDLSSVTNASDLFSGCRSLTSIPPINLSSVTNAERMFRVCSSLTSIPPIDLSSVTNANDLFRDCDRLITIPPLNTSNMTSGDCLFYNCNSLTTVEGIDFSGLTSDISSLFGWSSNMSNLTRFIVNGKINVNISDNYSIKALTAIDYDSVKSILAAADRTDNTNAKTLAFNRTMTDQNGELAALVTSCTSKGWTITGLTIK